MTFGEPKYKQVETIELAPDAIVFINGSDTVKDDNGNVYEIRNDITDINTSLSIESTPGDAGFTISIPDHSVRRYVDTRYNALKLMSEVEIYMKGRFPMEKTDGSLEYPFYPVFWGVIISVIENYNDGFHTINVSCADILRWWEIVTTNINPSAVATLKEDLTDHGITDQKEYMEGQSKKGDDINYEANQNKEIQMWPFKTKFVGLSIGEILVELSKLNYYNLMPLRSSLDAAYGSSDGVTDKIDAQLQDLLKNENEDLMSYWRGRFDQIGRNLRIYGIDNVRQTPNLDGVYHFDFNQENFLEVKPYPFEAGVPNATESELKSKLDLAKEIKDIIQFEFFMDVNGELIFKPPFYNMNVINNVPSVIKDEDILDWGFTLSEADVYTRVDVTGSFWELASQAGAQVNRGIWIDFYLAKKYGFRATQRECNWLITKKQCLQYAQAELARLNSLVRQGTLNIIGRPEIRLGYPIYIPARDAFYYVKSIDHTFSFGGSFTTTLGLVAERRRLRDERGDPLKNGVIKNIDALVNTTKTIPGDSIANQNQNYMTQIYDICFSKNKKVQIMTEPNFINNYDNVASVKFGNWEIIKNLKLADTNDPTLQYQISDGEGFELVVPFKYGKDLNFSETSTVQKKLERGQLETDANKAQYLNPDGLKLTVNPNNTALTLDNEDASMLYIFDRNARTDAQRAMNVNSQRYLEQK